MNITIELMNTILSYLATRPYNEVVNLVNEIQKQFMEQQPKVEEVKEEVKTK